MRESIDQYVLRTLEDFRSDPPDSAFQCGYQAAFEEMASEFHLKDEKKDALHAQNAASAASVFPSITVSLSDRASTTSALVRARFTSLNLQIIADGIWRYLGNIYGGTSPVSANDIHDAVKWNMIVYTAVDKAPAPQ